MDRQERREHLSHKVPSICGGPSNNKLYGGDGRHGMGPPRQLLNFSCPNIVVVGQVEAEWVGLKALQAQFCSAESAEARNMRDNL